MIKAVRITWTRKILDNEKRFKMSAKKTWWITIDFLCYFDIYYDGQFKYLKNDKKINDYNVFRIDWLRWVGMKKWLIYYYWILNKKKTMDRSYLIGTDYYSKFNQLLFFNHYNFSTPTSIFFAIDNIYINKYITLLENKFIYPFIAKDIYKDRGEWVLLVENRQQLKNIILEQQNNCILFQEYIVNTWEFRIITVWNDIVGSFKRYNPHSYKNNLKKWTIFENISINRQLKNTIVDIIKKYKLDFSWIDIITSWNKYYLLEINITPQFKRMEAVTWIDVIQKLMMHIKKIK